jgi:hypothetical protein
MVCYMLAVAFLIEFYRLRDGTERLANAPVVSLFLALLCWREILPETESTGSGVLDETLSMTDRIGSRDGIAHAVLCPCKAKRMNRSSPRGFGDATVATWIV